MPRTRFYYTLLVRSNETDAPWEIEFGDYDRSVVLDERSDWLDHYDEHDKKRLKKNTLLVTTPDASIGAINDVVFKLNFRD